MQVVKNSPIPESIEIQKLNSGEIFEYDNVLYIKSSAKDSKIGDMNTCVCVALSSGTYVEIKFGTEVFKATLTKPLGYTLI